MIDPLTRQPIPNGLTAPASNVAALQAPTPQPGNAQQAQGVPAPQQPGPWGANPFAAAPAPDGTGDNQMAIPIQMPMAAPTGPMNGPTMPPVQRAPRQAPMPQSANDPNMGGSSYSLAPSANDPNLDAVAYKGLEWGGPGPVGMPTSPSGPIGFGESAAPQQAMPPKTPFSAGPFGAGPIARSASSNDSKRERAKNLAEILKNGPVSADPTTFGN